MDTETTPDIDIDLDSVTADLSGAFDDPNPAPLDHGNEPAETPQFPKGQLPPDEVWASGDSNKPGPPPKGNPPEPAAKAPDLVDPASFSFEQAKAIYEYFRDNTPDGAQLFPDDIRQAKTWNDLRDRSRELESELNSLKATSGGAKEELARLRQEYSALDRIRHSDAYQAEVFAPQSEALAKAKSLGAQAGMDESVIEDIFSAENVLEAEQALLDLPNQALQNLLRPLVGVALDAREKGMAAMKAKNPLEEVKAWEAKTQQLKAQQSEMLTAQGMQMERAALDAAFHGPIAQSVLGKTKAAQQAHAKLAQEIQSQTPIEPERVYSALLTQEMMPVLIRKMQADAQTTAQLRAEVARLGGNPSTSPALPATAGKPHTAGRLPSGSAWDS